MTDHPAYLFGLVITLAIVGLGAFVASRISRIHDDEWSDIERREMLRRAMEEGR